MENENIQGGMELIQGRTLIRSEIYHLSSVWKSPICLAGNRVSKLLLHFLEHTLNLEAVYIGEYALPACMDRFVQAGRVVCTLSYSIRTNSRGWYSPCSHRDSALSQRIFFWEP